MLTYAHVCTRMLTYAGVCVRMLTYAHVCSRMLTYAECLALRFFLIFVLVSSLCFFCVSNFLSLIFFLFFALVSSFFFAECPALRDRVFPDFCTCLYACSSPHEWHEGDCVCVYACMWSDFVCVCRERRVEALGGRERDST